MKKQIFTYILLIVCALSMAFAEDVTVQFGPKSIGLNESFPIEFSTQHSIQGQPDFSPLQTDFDILSSSHGMSTTILNGVVTQETRWNLTLRGKHEGQLTIPPIQFGQYTSSPQTIEVTNSRAPTQDEAIFMETEVHPSESVYEQTQLTYVIRLYCSLKIAQGAFSELTTNDPDTIIERLGNDLQFEHYHQNGTRYVVIERKYAVFPQHVGELVFAPVIFEGQIIKGRHSIYDLNTQFTQISSKEKRVEVKPIPATFQKTNWFAANDVNLTEEWSTDPDKVVLGEPVTWTLKITADGCPGKQIPDISLTLPAELKQYLDKPESSTQPNASGVVGTKQLKIALIATKIGAIELPGVDIKWWDLKTSEVRHVQLPARTIHVKGGEVAMETSVAELARPEIAPETNPVWVWYMIGFNAFVLAGLSLFVFRKRFVKTAKPDSLSRIKNRLRHACQSCDAKQAEACLLVWGGMVYPDVKPLNMMGIKEHVSPDLRQAMDELYQALYGQATDWQGEALWKAFSEFKPKKQAAGRKKSELLRELYPD